MPVNRSRPIVARTDAENSYLDRDDNRGQVILPTNITERFMIREQLHNGRLTVFFQPVGNKVKVGEIYIFSMGLKDPAMPDALEVEVRVKMVEEVQQPKPKAKKEPKGGSGVDNKGSGEKAPTHGLPPWGLLTKDGRKIGEDESKPRPERFTDLDGGTIQDLGEDRVCYNINYDNAFHLKYRADSW